MLCQYSFKNYKSFKDEALLDFYPDNINEHNETLIVDKNDNQGFLPVIALYGPNGGGKTTVLESLYSVLDLITYYIDVIKQPNPKLSKYMEDMSLSDKYHKFDKKCASLPTEFELNFRIKEKTFNYFISILKGKIIEENLYFKITKNENAQVVFERNAKETKLGAVLNDIVANKVSESLPLLSYLAITYDIDLINQVIDWFNNVQIMNYDNPLFDIQAYYPKTEKQKQQLFNFLYSMGINASDSRAVKDSDGKIIEVFLKHKTKNNDVIEIPFGDESAGTRKVFNMLYRIIKSLNNGLLTIVDELDANLHPKLLQYIIELYTNPETNKKGAQLIFTSHDLSTMNSDVFRRDEIYFCALNPLNASKLYSLSSFRKNNGKKPRNDESYGKQYLEGRYGADPYLKKILNWDNKNEKG